MCLGGIIHSFDYVFIFEMFGQHWYQLNIGRSKYNLLRKNWNDNIKGSTQESEEFITDIVICEQE